MAEGTRRCGKASQEGPQVTPALPDSYPLPCPFPDGPAWAAIRGGVVINMVYMKLPDGVSFHVHRKQSRGRLARDGEVWAGEVRAGRFWPKFESGDIRRTGELNTARRVCV